MAKAPKICFDRILPQRAGRQHLTRLMPDGRTRAISPIGKKWANASTIRMRFLGGTQEQQDMVQAMAPEWTQHANLNFEFGDDPRSEIRVSFDSNDGAWSYVGTDNLGIPLHAATLNLGWQDQGVILHEFGHMIGLSHEHQNPDGGIEWNEEAVIRDLSGPPNFWDEQTIRHNVLNRYRADQVHGTDFDPDSVMLYAFPDEWTLNMGATHENEDISDQDRDFVRSERMYPGRDTGDTLDDQAIELTVARGVEGEISAAHEEDVYRFVVTDTATHLIETAGSTDVVMSLFGPNSSTQLVASDDDGGVGRNARINATLQPGIYYAIVRHFNPTRTGEYRIAVSAF
jgi:hypothetical protein